MEKAQNKAILPADLVMGFADCSQDVLQEAFDFLAEQKEKRDASEQDSGVDVHSGAFSKKEIDAIDEAARQRRLREVEGVAGTEEQKQEKGVNLISEEAPKEEKHPKRAAEPLAQKVRVDLVVPFKEKDLAKSLGAWWDPAAKVWYAPHGFDKVYNREQKKWLPIPPDNDEKFKEFAATYGLVYEILPDGSPPIPHGPLFKWVQDVPEVKDLKGEVRGWGGEVKFLPYPALTPRVLQGKTLRELLTTKSFTRLFEFVKKRAGGRCESCFQAGRQLEGIWDYKEADAAMTDKIEEDQKERKKRATMYPHITPSIPEFDLDEEEGGFDDGTKYEHRDLHSDEDEEEDDRIHEERAEALGRSLPYPHLSEGPSGYFEVRGPSFPGMRASSFPVRPPRINKTLTRKLVSVVFLCEKCYYCIHPRQAHVNGKRGHFTHAEKIHGWTWSFMYGKEAEAMEVYHQRNRFDWEQDLSLLTEAGLKFI